jgi:hypothetical protein
MTKPPKRPAYRAWRDMVKRGMASLTDAAAAWIEADEQFKRADRAMSRAWKKAGGRVKNFDPRFVQARGNAMDWRSKVAVMVARELASSNGSLIKANLKTS